MNRTQKTSRRPPMNYLNRKRVGVGKGGCSIIKIFWPFDLNDLWSKKICRPKMIVWSLVDLVIIDGVHTIEIASSQLAATSWISSRRRGVFFPVAPPGGKTKCSKKQKLTFIFQGLADYLDNYRMSTSLLQTLNMTRCPINPVL